MNTSFFHPLHSDIALPKRLNDPFDYEPSEVCRVAIEEVKRVITNDLGMTANDEGKMFGVLVAKDSNGQLGYLAAYSGQINTDSSFFVPAIFDYLQPDGYFKRKEKEIMGIITATPPPSPPLQGGGKAAENARTFLNSNDEREGPRLAGHKGMGKAIEDPRPATHKGKLDGESDEDYIKRRQFENAELHRWKLRQRERDKVEKERQAKVKAMKTLRRKKSEALQRWLFSNFIISNGRGQKIDLLKLWSNNHKERTLHVAAPLPEGEGLGVGSQSLLPPSGSGECCEPKLLEYALDNDLKPISMAMFWWGRSPKGEVRHHLHFYPACNGKCKPILHWMLQGIDVDWQEEKPAPIDKVKIIDNTDNYVIISKPSGLQSVPGKNRQPSVLSWFKDKYPTATGPMMVHRLDRDTSGLMVIAKNLPTYIALQRQFAEHTIRKRYVAILERRPQKSDGTPLPLQGRISLPLMPDLDDRPRQTVDFTYGKEAITDYKVVDINKETGECRVGLIPHTGRTHQLRVHCAYVDGLNASIKGDPLYGTKADRLYLHAEYLEFTDPSTGERKKYLCCK